MKIELVGFRCHLDTQFNFPDASLILCKGQSGIGKSTIFAAIYWALYGSLQHIYNNAGQSSKCYVKLELDSVVIYRQKKPELLKVETFLEKSQEKSQGKEVTTYEDKIAQQIIKEKFGSKDVWTACCYLGQGMRSYLLTANNSDKMDLLHILSFNAENPETFISKIESELGRITIEFKTSQALFTSECEQFNRDISTDALDMSMFLPTTERETIRLTLIQFQKRAENETQAHLEQERLRGKQASLKENRDRLFHSLDQLPEIPQEELARLEEEIEILSSKSQRALLHSEGKRLQAELCRLDLDLHDCLPHSFEVSENDVLQVTMAQQKYDENIALAHQLGVPYNTEKIQDEIKIIEHRLESQPRLQTWLTVSRLQEKLNSLKGPTATNSDVSQAQVSLQELESVEKIIC